MDLDRYVAILYVKPPTPQILEFCGGFWILDFGDFGFWILGILGILDFGDFGFWILGILDFGSWGFWILDCGDFGFWILGILGILDFGFWGFWILDFGFWGFWILDLGDFGFWILGPKSKIQNPPIQNPKSKLFWPILGILDFGPLCSKSLCGPNFGDFGFWILGILDLVDFGFWIWGFWILGILDFGDFGFWILGILDFGLWGFWILDFGPLCSKSLCEAPNVLNLGILNFGFWGFWGFWILDFGDFEFWILDFEVGGMKKFGLEANFGFYIRVRRQCTPPRVGGFYIIDTMLCVTIYKHV